MLLLFYINTTELVLGLRRGASVHPLGQNQATVRVSSTFIERVAPES